MLCLLIFGTTIFFIPTLSFAQTTVPLSNQKVIYELPYPGILPDHPLYIFKQTRDKIIEFLTRDNLKKAELYLLNSDKLAVMAKQLGQQGKGSLAVKTIRQAEEYTIKIIKLLNLAKKQGSRPTDDFLRRLKNSNVKHAEIIEELLRELPQGSAATLTDILRINEQAHRQLEKM